MNNYFEVFKQGFIDKTLNDEEIINSVNNLSYEQKVYFNALCLKTFGIASFDSIYGMVSYKNWEGGFDIKAISANELSEQEKESALSWKSFPSKYESNDYWHYHSKRFDMTSDITRPLAIKIEVSAANEQDADKIWKVVAPYLFNHENDICFKVPRSDYFIKNIDGGIEKGNFITIYTLSDEQAFNVLRDLDQLLTNSNLDVQKYTNDYYLDVGDSGILSAIIDREPYSGSYIPRISDDSNVGRPDRPDTFAYLKNNLQKENLLTDNNIKLIHEKEKKLKFGEFVNDRPKFSYDAIKDAVENHTYCSVSYIIGHYNCSIDDLKTILSEESGIYPDSKCFQNLLFNFDYKDVVDIAINSPYFDDFLLVHTEDSESKDIEKYMCSLIPSLCEKGEFSIVESMLWDISKEDLGDNVVNDATYYFLNKVIETGDMEYFNMPFYRICSNHEWVNNIIETLKSQQELGYDISISLKSLDLGCEDEKDAFVALYTNGFINNDSIHEFMDRKYVSIETKNILQEIIDTHNIIENDIVVDDTSIEAEEETEL